MERLEGRTLRAAARELAEAHRRISAREVFEIARQVCDGLQRAHTNETPVIHRDLKPDNIYLHKAPHAELALKLIDFGVAELLGGGTAQPSAGIIGTPRYMAPEVLRGDRLGPQSDLYAVALVVYELLTLRFPWDVDVRNISQVAEAHLHQAPSPASRFCPWIPKSVDDALTRALSKDPRDRQDTVYAFSRSLYELQIANDGSADASLDANTTVPSLATLALGRSGIGGADTGESEDTERTTDQPAMEASEGASVDVNVSLGATRREQKGERGGKRDEDLGALADTSGMQGAAVSIPSEDVHSESVQLPPPSGESSLGAVERTPPRRSTARRRLLVGGFAAGLAVVGAGGLGLRRAAIAPRVSAVANVPVVTARAPAGTAMPSLGESRPANAAGEGRADPVEPAMIDPGMVGKDLDAARPNLGVAPLPSQRALAEVLGAAEATAPHALARATAAVDGAAPLARPSPRPMPNGGRRPDDGADLLSVPR
jgi:hypothetical protein